MIAYLSAVGSHWGGRWHIAPLIASIVFPSVCDIRSWLLLQFLHLVDDSTIIKKVNGASLTGVKTEISVQFVSLLVTIHQYILFGTDGLVGQFPCFRGHVGQTNLVVLEVDGSGACVIQFHP